MILEEGRLSKDTIPATMRFTLKTPVKPRSQRSGRPDVVVPKQLGARPSRYFHDLKEALSLVEMTPKTENELKNKEDKFNRTVAKTGMLIYDDFYGFVLLFGFCLLNRSHKFLVYVHSRRTMLQFHLTVQYLLHSTTDKLTIHIVSLFIFRSLGPNKIIQHSNAFGELKVEQKDLWVKT